MAEKRRIDPLVGHMTPPAEGWLYQEGAGWYDPSSIEAVEPPADEEDTDGA